MSETLEKRDRGFVGRLTRVRLRVYLVEIFDCDCGHGGVVEAGDFAKYINGILLAALADEKFWRFMEWKDKKSDKENGESDHANDNYQVAPAHIARNGAAVVTRIETGGITRR